MIKHFQLRLKPFDNSYHEMAVTIVRQTVTLVVPTAPSDIILTYPSLDILLIVINTHRFYSSG